MERKNNYDDWRRDWRARFLTLDRDALCRKLPWLRQTEAELVVRYFIWDVVLDWETGAPSAPVELQLYDEMNILTLLWYCKEGAARSGEFVPFDRLPHAAPYGPAFRRGNLETLAASFAGRPRELERALLALGGRKLPTGDVGYEIEVFPDFPMQVLFWDGDDEFPAQANLLFDKTCTDFIHVESVVTIASQAEVWLERLAANAAPGSGRG